MEPKTLKLLEENIGSCLHDIGVGKDFLIGSNCLTINKWDFIKPKNFCKAKETIICVRKSPPNDRESLPTIYLTEDYPEY